MTHLPLRFLLSTYSFFLETGRLAAAAVVPFTRIAAQWNIHERSSGPPPVMASHAKPAVWIHAASLGESKLLVRFLEILRKKHPGQTYVLTATTRTGVEYLRRCTGTDILAAGFLPFDTIRLMRKMLSGFGISRVWLMETELWPSMMWACIQRGVPVGLVNARIEEKSLVSYRRVLRLLSPLFAHPDIVLAQNQTYAGRFVALGVAPSRIRVTGNLKSYVTVHPPLRAERQRLRGEMHLSDTEVCITAGCMHPGEGAVLRNALDIMRTMSFPVKCIAVPRHLKDTAALARELGNGTVIVKEAAAAQPWDICVVDKMGVLEAMYKIADAAFVGGTFDATGGHNMWDAAQFGIPVFFGPGFYTQQESADMLLRAGVAFAVKSSRELAGAVISALRDNARRFLDAQSIFKNDINTKSHSIEDLIP